MARIDHQSLGEVLGERGYIRGPFGSTLVRRELLQQGIPVYEQQHAITGTREFRFFVSKQKFKELSRFQVRPNDLIISCSGTIGRISVIKPHDAMGIISQALLILRPQTNRVLPGFLYFFLNSWEGQRALTQASHGSVQVNIAPRAVVERIEVPVPPIPEQRAIVHILGSLNDKIELNRRMNVTLESMARALFKSWFVDFEPVRAKAEGSETGLPQHFADLFPDSFKHSEMGEIPTGWRVAPLPEIIDVNPPRSLRKGDVAPYLAMANMPTRSSRAMDVFDREFGSGMRFINGDTLVARITPCLENGKTCFVDFLSDGQVGWGSTEYIVLRAKPPLPTVYAYFLARTEDFRTFAISNMTGTSGRQRVPADSLAHFMTVVPPAEVVDFVGAYWDDVMRTIKANDEESRTLAALRDALLPKLLSGEIRLQDAGKFVGGTA